MKINELASGELNSKRLELRILGIMLPHRSVCSHSLVLCPPWSRSRIFTRLRKWRTPRHYLPFSRGPPSSAPKATSPMPTAPLWCSRPAAHPLSPQAYLAHGHVGLRGASAAPSCSNLLATPTGETPQIIHVDKSNIKFKHLKRGIATEKEGWHVSTQLHNPLPHSTRN